MSVEPAKLGATPRRPVVSNPVPAPEVPMRTLLAFLLVTAPSLCAAQRSLDLTGKPVAAIAEPFTSISGVQELAPSLAVVTDNMEAKVSVVDFARGTVRQVGAKGRGPNEYQYPSPPIAGPGGVYIFDTYQKRAIAIGANGAIAAMHQLPDHAALSRVRGSDRAGRFYFERSEFDPNTGRFSDTLPVVRWDRASNRVESVARVWGGGRVIIQRGGQPASLAREITPFPHLDAWVPLPEGGVAMVRHDPFRIDVVDGPAVGIRHGQSIAATTIPVTARERDWYRARHTPGRVGAAMTNGGTGPQSQGPQWEDAHFPATMPPFIAADLVVSPEGAIWIPRSFSGGEKTRRYTIHDRTGRQIGDAILDANARVVGFGAGSVYVARTDPADDLVYLGKYRTE